MDKRREIEDTLHEHLDCPKTKWPKNSQKWPRLRAVGVEQPQNQERAVSWATWLKTTFQGYLVHPQPPTFGSFQASESPHETPRPPYQRSVGEAGGQPGPRKARALGGSTGALGAEKRVFSKAVPRTLGMLKQVFLARFEPVVACFGTWKMPKCLENGAFWGHTVGQKWVKNAIFR